MEIDVNGSDVGSQDSATEATAQLAARLAAAEGELVKARVAREIDVALLTAGVTDLEAGRALVEKHVAELARKDGSEESDALVKQAVAAVRKKQAYLFAVKGSLPSGAEAGPPWTISHRTSATTNSLRSCEIPRLASGSALWREALRS